ncbi:phospho-sugar mutase [Angustibacter peucedani]
MAVDDELLARAVLWRDDDPDDATRAELDDLVARVRGGDLEALAELADRFDGTLEFGTAGLRGAIAAGPNRMNRAVVIRAAAGLTAYLAAENGRPPRVVVGFDARHRSDDFARDTAAVVTAAGGEAFVLPRPLPTPVLAFAIRHLGVDAGVMVTASHNPPQDNGYKVYLGDGSQIVPPADAGIAAAIAAVPTVQSVPRADDGWTTLGDDVLESYLDAVAAVVRPDSPRDLRVVHTPLHGVGRDVLVGALQRAGFAAPYVVPSQGDPDPDFPTVAFPNPEEAGAIDAALDAAREQQADVVLANDPDADRCAVAVPDPAADGGWRMLGGDEVGVLLGAYVVRRLEADGGVPEGTVMANSVVSGRQLAAVCAAHGVRHVETLTGFKWISRVPGLRYGYEEALGYCVDPARVRDKDGVSAALLVAELAATLKAEGRTLLDELDDLAAATGVHLTGQHSVRVEDLSLITDAMARLRAEPPAELAGAAVERRDDLATGSAELPPTDGLRWYTADGSRVIVRPSGTEPKLKAYLEVVEPVTGSDGAAARAVAAERLAALRADVAAAVGL